MQRDHCVDEREEVVTAPQCIKDPTRTWRKTCTKIYAMDYPRSGLLFFREFDTFGLHIRPFLLIRSRTALIRCEER